MLAYLIVHYDFKLEDGAVYPKKFIFETNVLPNRKASVLFRKRE